MGDIDSGHGDWICARDSLILNELVIVHVPNSSGTFHVIHHNIASTFEAYAKVEAEC